MLVASAAADCLLDLRHRRQPREECRVDIALKLNVMAVFAVVTFISAVLLGAF
jgi:hypothetical protein